MWEGRAHRHRYTSRCERGGRREGCTPKAVPVLGVCEEEDGGDEEVVEEDGCDGVTLWLWEPGEGWDEHVETGTRGDDRGLEDSDWDSGRGSALQTVGQRGRQDKLKGETCLEDTLHATPLERVRMTGNAELARTGGVLSARDGYMQPKKNGRIETVALEQLVLIHCRAVDEELRLGRLLRLALGRGALWPANIRDKPETRVAVAAGEGGGVAVGLGRVDGTAVVGEDGLEEGGGG